MFAHYRINNTHFIESNDADTVWIEQNIQWVLLIVVVTMVIIMAIVVGYLLYRRRRQTRQSPELKRESTQPVQPPGIEDEYPRQNSMNSVSRDDFEGQQEGVEGQPANETGFQTIEMAENDNK